MLVVTDVDKVSTHFCVSGCTADTNWQAGDVDTTNALAAEYDPYVLSVCGTPRPTFSAWYFQDSVVAIRPDGSVAFAHAAHMLRTCPGSSSPSYLPGLRAGRLSPLRWASKRRAPGAGP